MSDQKTIAAYDQRVEEYATFTTGAAIEPQLVAFIASVPSGGYVLDLGCGPATASSHMRKAGLRIDPVDASSQMVQFANERYNIGARVARFHDIEGENVYDAVWANFSLLHARREDLPHHLSALHEALVPGGIFHITMKLGQDEQRDSLNRQYTYYSQTELTALLIDAGFSLINTKIDSALGLAGDMEPYIAI